MTHTSTGTQEAGLPRFEQSRSRRALRPWVLQLLLAALVPFAVQLFEELALGWSELRGSPFGLAGLQLFNFLAIALLAFVIGVLMARSIAPRAATWVWVVPVSLLLLAVISDLSSFRAWHPVWVDYFYWENPGATEGPILREVLTYPALSALAYSAGAWLGRRGPRTRAA